MAEAMVGIDVLLTDRQKTRGQRVAHPQLRSDPCPIRMWRSNQTAIVFCIWRTICKLYL